MVGVVIASFGRKNLRTTLNYNISLLISAAELIDAGYRQVVDGDDCLRLGLKGRDLLRDIFLCPTIIFWIMRVNFEEPVKLRWFQV